jgi:hypothetical protein
MNGKNRRCKGCYSRGISGFKRNGQPTVHLPTYNLPTFPTINNSDLSPTQINVLNRFKNYQYIQIEEEYSYNSNTPRTIIKIRQSHFENGTVRITKPGIYLLQEDIEFEPNPENDFMPTGQQITSGQYPVGANGAYHLGFFAAITIEANGIIFDMQGHTIKQTILHNLQQRFYSNIELSSAPFIPNQGPGKFSVVSTFKFGENVLIKNGILSRSSHHGIHGNKMRSIVLQNLLIEDFEVAGIALNGATDSILNAITIKNTSLNIRVLSTYSQARFIRTFLKRVKSMYPTAMLGTTSIDVIIDDLYNGLENAKNAVLGGLTPSNLFGNTNFQCGYDGNVYGIVLNVNGVVINGFIKDRPSDAIGNQQIYMQNIYIKNIISRPTEVIAINSNSGSGGAYGGSRQAGPVGDVLSIKNIINSDKSYKQNILTNAQLIIAKNNNPKLGTTSITLPIVNWSEGLSGYTDISGVMQNEGYYYVRGGDSMGHTMKGNIGLFISAGENININGLTVDTVKSKGSDVGPNTLGIYQGGNSRGVIVTGSSNINLNFPVIINVTTENINSTQQDIEVLGTSSNVRKGGVLI